MANPTGFAAGDLINIYSAANDGVTRKTMRIRQIEGSTFWLFASIGWSVVAGDHVWKGLSRDVNDENMITNFIKNFGGKLGASHISPFTNNGMEMEFTVRPAGIEWQKVPRIVFDTTRQMENVAWKLNNGVWNAITQASPKIPETWPSGDEVPNDDDIHGNFDQDVRPRNEHIYVADTPGMRGNNVATDDRIVLRYNFREFVRVRFDGIPFENKNGVIEGSRASSKIDWRARLDLVREPNSGLWSRNNNQPAGANENEIEVDHKNLLQNDPR